MVRKSSTDDLRSGSSLITFVIVIAALYFARVVLIPLALSVMLAFLLAPLTIRLRHWKFGRVPSSLLVVLMAFIVIGGLGTLLTSQATDLARKLPGYQQNVQKKLDSIRASGGGIINRITHFTHLVSDGVLPAASVPAKTQPGEDKPVPVEIRKSPFAPLEIVQSVAGSVLSVLVTLAIVIVFVIFMLIQREDLRDRLIRLVGAKQLNVTTQALDDAAQRLSRYLLAQLVVNVGFGILAGVGLFFIGVPNPFLWAILAAVLRYIPYLGIWVAAAMPAIIAFAVEAGWVKVPMIFGLYFGIDLIMYNFVEPYLYGSSTGISPVAILVSAVFWTWLWGPVGLLLATPLTVCVVVIGRYVPSMSFLEVVLSDEQVLEPEARFYQRMLAMDLEEATEVAEEFLKGKSMQELEDKVIIPALILAEEDRHKGRLDEKHEMFILESTRILMEDLAERGDEISREGEKAKTDGEEKEAEKPAEPMVSAEEASVVCIPARDEADEIAAKMLGELLRKKGVAARVLSCAALAGECIEQLKTGQAKIACVTVIPPFGYMHARYMCRRLKAQFPDLKVVAAVLTETDVNEVRQRRPKIQADEVVSSLQQALTAVVSFMPETIKQKEESLPAPA